MTGRRGPAVDRALLTAALDELAESGYTAFSMEGVAARIGVHKTTVYRRWSDKEALLTDTVLGLAVEEFAIPDTGDIDADLRAAIRARAAWLTGPFGRPLVAMLGSDAGRLPQVRRSITQIMVARTDMVTARLAAAAASGQLPPGTDPTLLLTTLIAPLYLSLLVVDQPFEESDADRAAAIALTAARAGLIRRSRGTALHEADPGAG